MTISVTPAPGASQRTRNRLREHGASGFVVVSDPRNPAFDKGNRQWISLRSLEENVSLARWGSPGVKEAWEGWLPMDELVINPLHSSDI